MKNSSARTRDDTLDDLFHALANRTRRAMLSRLAEAPARVTDLAAPFAMSLPAASQHLRVLEDAGLVRRTVDGRVHHCALDAGPLHRADAWLAHYRQFWDDTLARLADFAERDGKA